MVSQSCYLREIVITLRQNVAVAVVVVVVVAVVTVAFGGNS
jgi:hypothetical protein